MSSDSYAGRLSEYRNKGVCGLPESIDSKRSLDFKIGKLIEMIRSAHHIVVISGAGISTNAGIPDFRGPNGIWTAEEGMKKKKSKKIKQQCPKRKGFDDKDIPSQHEAKRSRKSLCEGMEGSKMKSTSSNDEAGLTKTDESKELSFEKAIPTITHKSITRLVAMGIIKYVITQNVDGLHRRSGLPRNKHAVLHGCIFTEKCEKCQTEYFRDYDVGGVSFKKTGRRCEKHDCDGDLRDTILDWEDELPDEDWCLSQQHCAQSDLVIAIGTSLRIEPAGSLPTYGKRFVIINKQVTPYDSKAALIVKADVDTVFSRLMDALDE